MKYFKHILILSLGFVIAPLASAQSIASGGSCKEVFSSRQHLSIEERFVSTLNMEEFKGAAEGPLKAMYESFRWGDDYKATRIKLYKNLISRFTYVIKNANGSNFFHGSSSPALMAVFETPDSAPMGLVPTGEMLKKGMLPFSGELFAGINPDDGVNRNAISTAPFTFIDYAISYAKSNADVSWTPESSKHVISVYEEFDNSKTYDREVIARLEKIKIEKLRQARWAKLSELEKTLIKENFPVLFAIRIKDSNRLNPLPDRYGIKEVLVMGGVKISEINAIFVPANKVDFVKSHLPKDSHIEVAAIEPVQKTAIHYGEFIQQFKGGIFEGD